MLKAFLLAALVVLGTAVGVIPLYFGGYISRELIVAASPDGRLQAVCRGWYPHGTEYELWLRRTGEWFGQKLGPVGSESMGRCAAVAWTAAGSRIAAATTGGWVTVWDADARGVTGSLRLDDLVYRGGNERPYTTPHMVQAIAFESDATLRVSTCERLWTRTHRTEHAFRCGSASRTDMVAVALEPPRGAMRRYAIRSQNDRSPD